MTTIYSYLLSKFAPLTYNKLYEWKIQWNLEVLKIVNEPKNQQSTTCELFSLWYFIDTLISFSCVNEIYRSYVQQLISYVRLLTANTCEVLIAVRNLLSTVNIFTVCRRENKQMSTAQFVLIDAHSMLCWIFYLTDTMTL